MSEMKKGEKEGEIEGKRERGGEKHERKFFGY